jgi:hypothetical protein
MDQNKLIELKSFIINNLLPNMSQNGLKTEYSEEVLYFMAPEMVDLELEYTDNCPLYAVFLHDLREVCELRWDQRPPNNELSIELYGI